MTKDRTVMRPTTSRLWEFVAANRKRILADLVIVGLWVVLVTLASLSAGWSRLQFYLLLGVGVVCYVQITSGWDRLERE